MKKVLKLFSHNNTWYIYKKKKHNWWGLYTLFMHLGNTVILSWWHNETKSATFKKISSLEPNIFSQTRIWRNLDKNNIKKQNVLIHSPHHFTKLHGWLSWKTQKKSESSKLEFERHVRRKFQNNIQIELYSRVSLTLSPCSLRSLHSYNLYICNCASLKVLDK